MSRTTPRPCKLCGKPVPPTTSNQGYQYYNLTCSDECNRNLAKANTTKQMSDPKARKHLSKVVKKQHIKEGNKARFLMTDEIREKIGSAQRGKPKAWQADKEKMDAHRKTLSKVQKERFKKVGIEKHELFRPEVRKVALERSMEDAKTNPLRGKFETNVHAKMWFLISPRGERFEFRNLRHFIREHRQLFSERQLLCGGSDPNKTRIEACLNELTPRKKKPVSVSQGWMWDLEAEMKWIKANQKSRGEQ